MMGTLWDNLYLYEVVLLFLGAFLFAILCAGLVYYIVKKEDFKKLIYFFPIAIIMIAYPSIKEIQIGNSKIAMKEYEERLLNNPDDLEARKELEEVTEKLEKRASTVEDFRALGEANLILGNSDKAIDLTNKAIEKKRKNFAKNEALIEKSEDSDSTVINNQEMDASFATLNNIIEVAKIQKEVKKNPATLQDTVELKKQIDNTSWSNPGTETYLRRQILRQAVE